MTVIEIPLALRRFTQDKDKVDIQAATIGEAFQQLTQHHPDLKQQLFDDNGSLRSFVNVYINETDIRTQSNLDTTVQSGDVVQIVPSVAGGH